MNHKRFNVLSPSTFREKHVCQSDFYHRKSTERYQAKKKVLYYMWIGVLVSVIINPVLSYAVGLAMFMTFFSFFVLDESE